MSVPVIKNDDDDVILTDLLASVSSFEISKQATYFTASFTHSVNSYAAIKLMVFE